MEIEETPAGEEVVDVESDDLVEFLPPAEHAEVQQLQEADFKRQVTGT